jgi:hypothetical protein
MVDLDHSLVLEVVRSALHSKGWESLDPLGTAIATKRFKTVNVEDTALAFLSSGDGYNRTLAFEFYSEGRNTTATDGVLIPVDATSAQAYALALHAAANAEKSINGSFAVRLA